MGGSRLRILARRVFAAARCARRRRASAAWFFFVRDSGDDDGPPDAAAPGVSAKAGKVVRGARPRTSRWTRCCCWDSRATRVPPIVRERQLGGVLVGPENGASAELTEAILRAGEGRRAHPAADRRGAGGRRSTARSPSCPRPSGPSTSATSPHPSAAQSWAAETATRAASRRLSHEPLPGRRRRHPRQPGRAAARSPTTRC